MLGLTKLQPGPGHVALSEREPRALEPGHVRLEVRAAGICGTDMSIAAGRYACVPPVTMGHELCGVVIEAAAGVDREWLGRRVSCETFYSTCGTCRLCRAGRPNLCLQRRSIGTHVDGAFAPTLALPAVNLHEVPATLADSAAALVEPLACVCQSLLDPPVLGPGDRVLVIGPGPIGLIAAQVAAAAGATVEVWGMERDAERLAVASALGAAAGVTPELTSPDGDFDVTVECSGSGGGVTAALLACRRGGHVVQIGLGGRPVEVPFDQICYRELTVTSGFASTPQSWRRAFRLLAEEAVDLGALVSEVVPLAEWERAFERTRNADGLKLVLDPAAAGLPGP